MSTASVITRPASNAILPPASGTRIVESADGGLDCDGVMLGLYILRRTQGYLLPPETHNWQVSVIAQLAVRDKLMSDGQNVVRWSSKTGRVQYTAMTVVEATQQTYRNTIGTFKLQRHDDDWLKACDVQLLQ